MPTFYTLLSQWFKNSNIMAIKAALKIYYLGIINLPLNFTSAIQALPA